MYLGYRKESDTKARVVLIHDFPSELPEDLIAAGVLVDSLPEPERVPGKRADLYINPETSELWYEYADIINPDQERIDRLEKENAELKKSNLDAQEAILELYEMITGK
ncbi:hypothetical protein NDK47_24000 [Brevibacillus ruminantium]|uniref:Uncharacterized protein n=1 Tax=Brevibacillus ruminantium TaxID=2950604 RepID=A0ABY4WIH6_9BACL|nr:hypothetical protein [Brevibacillus ruminantium]USG65149.1 hypothetical protein NDK47_24000 [Brevibacillus ruminantium]